MGLFSKKDVNEIIADLVHARFVQLGERATRVEGSTGLDIAYQLDTGERFELYNLILKTEGTRGRERTAIVNEHVDFMLQGMRSPSPRDLDDADLLAQVRVRLAAIQSADFLTFDYARPFAGNLHIVMCVDYPTTVAWVDDSALVGRDIEALWAAAYTNTLPEPFDDVEEVVPGIHALSGNSLFVATQALGFVNLIGTVLPVAPHGVVFGVPHRHLILAHVLDGADSIKAVADLARIVANQAQAEVPGGSLSPLIYLWRDGEVDVVGGPTEDGTISIDGSGRLADFLENLN